MSSNTPQALHYYPCTPYPTINVRALNQLLFLITAYWFPRGATWRCQLQATYLIVCLSKLHISADEVYLAITQLKELTARLHQDDGTSYILHRDDGTSYILHRDDGTSYIGMILDQKELSIKPSRMGSFEATHVQCGHCCSADDLHFFALQ